jgi:hypothetical protein
MADLTNLNSVGTSTTNLGGDYSWFWCNTAIWCDASAWCGPIASTNLSGVATSLSNIADSLTTLSNISNTGTTLTNVTDL